MYPLWMLCKIIYTSRFLICMKVTFSICIYKFKFQSSTKRSRYPIHKVFKTTEEFSDCKHRSLITWSCIDFLVIFYVASCKKDILQKGLSHHHNSIHLTPSNVMLQWKALFDHPKHSNSNLSTQYVIPYSLKIRLTTLIYYMLQWNTMTVSDSHQTTLSMAPLSIKTKLYHYALFILGQTLILSAHAWGVQLSQIPLIYHMALYNVRVEWTILRSLSEDDNRSYLSIYLYFSIIDDVIWPFYVQKEIVFGRMK